jgi:hypothetical protein
MADNRAIFKALVIGASVLVFILFVLLVLVWYRRRKRARAVAKQKLLRGEVSHYDSTGNGKQLYKKPALKATVARQVEEEEYTPAPTAEVAPPMTEPPSTIETVTPQVQQVPVVQQRRMSPVQVVKAPSPVASVRAEPVARGPSRGSEATDEEIWNVVIGSWYEHLIRHSATEYLRQIVKNSEGMKEKDLIPEMRLLLGNLPNVSVVRWSQLTAVEKASIGEQAKVLKDEIVASAARRFVRRDMVTQ